MPQFAYHVLGFGMTSDRDILPLLVGGDGELNGTGEPVDLTIGETHASQVLLFGRTSGGAFLPILVDDDGKIFIS